MPKSCTQYIKELKARIEELEGQFAYECECNKQLVEIQNENERLKKMLEFIPKFKLGDVVYFNARCYEGSGKGKVEKIYLQINGNAEECGVSYSITDADGYALRLPKEQVFASEEELNNYNQTLKGV